MKKNETLFKVHEKIHPQIYVFKDKHDEEWLKIGYTKRKDVNTRIREQYSTRLQLDPDAYTILHSESSVRYDGTTFVDDDVHELLKRKGVSWKGEFFKTDINTIKAAILSLKTGTKFDKDRYNAFSMRPEQIDAVDKTMRYFEQSANNPFEYPPAFLWNCKMRFGKTFTSYKLAATMGLTKILVLTYKPAVKNSWQEDLETHVDFDEWLFISRDSSTYKSIDSTKPYVAFASYQDLLGTTLDGEIKKHNEWIHGNDWDMIIVDEYHFGAWRDAARELTESDSSENEEEFLLGRLPIKGKYFLYLSGTPFRAIETGEFKEEQIFNWTYGDEQRAKRTWTGDNNPYSELPEMTLLTYKLPESIRQVAERGEFNEFDLNYFFRAKWEAGDIAHFIHENEVQKWLELIQGSFLETSIDLLKLGAEKPPFPFSDKNLKKILQHVIWYLPDVASCYAMGSLLREPQNRFYHDFDILVVAGAQAGIGADALIPVRDAMNNPTPFQTKTITLTCGKLTTGVTVNPWTGIFMLRSLKTPESYFQAAFRVQSPWTTKSEDGKREVYKEQCFVFDFAPNRALSQIAMYASKLDNRDITDTQKIDEFIRFLPVLAYDGFAMESVDAIGLLDMATGRTTATLLAKGWNSALLLNLNNDILKKLSDNKEAMNAINSIEAFRNAKNNKASGIIINTDEEIKRLKTKKSNQKLTKKEQKKLDELEKRYKENREIIKEKLKKLATRIPLFMYLTDYRENKLTDVITKLEPELFKRVTGLSIDDFHLLVSLGLFNENTMNTAVYNFRRYEDSSISYSGINMHQGEEIGYYSMAVSDEEFRRK